ncbi:MAG: hypothetical protein R2877_01745 [Bdellovibrionota bacterium]
MKGKDIYPLDRRKIDDWNFVMSNEKIMLDQDAKIIGYAKFFLSTIMNQSEFIDKLMESEVKRIEARTQNRPRNQDSSFS